MKQNEFIWPFEFEQDQHDDGAFPLHAAGAPVNNAQAAQPHKNTEIFVEDPDLADLDELDDYDSAIRTAQLAQAVSPMRFRVEGNALVPVGKENAEAGPYVFSILYHVYLAEQHL